MKFKTDLIEIASKKIIHIPVEYSQSLPSRGLVMAKVTIADISAILPIEPDGKGSHWFELDENFIKDLDLESLENLEIDLEPIKEWPEPDMPEDILTGLESEGLIEFWNSITTKAKWEWLRWIRSTSNPDTRAKRIEVASSKMKAGDKRPCCFNASSCTVPEVSKSGVLKDY
ncbi:YdeI/OmpD-associated family protein [Microaceticoccus formicicus]|uniref:YdeI/OmpD-associated family protein n=1 Tax=Microaceticoccus formicicus TaxID=3118105 RepID=UPI003CD012A0|nr:YdeI/OmpD-associated family protein [Peptoniphilaceae bacterium AMB_02]